MPQNELKLHDADRMVQHNIPILGATASLHVSGNPRMWMSVLTAQDPPTSLPAGLGDFAEFRHRAADGRHIRTWLFDGPDDRIDIEGLIHETEAECFVGTLPAPLEPLAEGSAPEQRALAVMLGQICSEVRLAELEWGDLTETQSVDLLRGGAAVARRLGRYETEAVLLRAALDIRKSANLLRLLSYAHANAHDYASAIIAAEQALDAKPELADGPFGDHLAELRAYGDLADELKQIAKAEPASHAGNGAVAYCLHNAQPHAQGGYAMRSHALATAIVQRGRPLKAFARPGFPSDSDTAIDTVPAAEQVGNVRYHFENGFGRRGRAYGYIAEAADYFARVFAANDIGLVHAATNFWTGLPAAIAARRLGLPFVYEVRSFWSITRDAREPGFSSSPQGRRDDALEAMVLAMADEVLTLNEAMRDRIVEMGIDRDRVTLAPNCVDPERFEPRSADEALATNYGIASDDIVIGYMGAMLGYEGIDLLVDAAAPLIRDNPQIRLLIVGADAAKRAQPGTIEYGLERQIETLGLASHIRLVDRVPPDTARALYTLFDICAYPRRAFEVCELVSPLKPLEAMAMGKTVIGSSVRALQDMIDHDRTGLIFEKGDIESLRATLRRAIDDESLRTRLGNAARDFVRQERNWQHVGETVDSVYRRAAATEPQIGAKLGALVDAHFDVPESIAAIRSALGAGR